MVVAVAVAAAVVVAAVAEEAEDNWTVRRNE